MNRPPPPPNPYYYQYPPSVGPPLPPPPAPGPSASPYQLYGRSQPPRSYTTPSPMPIVPPGGFPTPHQLIEKVPLIRSPAFYVPKPVTLPPDIHPLPDDVTDYFVYPHTIEQHALATLPAQLEKLRQEHSQHLHLLRSHAESKEKARRAAWNRIAPGFEGGGVMEPIRSGSVMIGPASSLPGRSSRGARRKRVEEPQKSVLEEDDEDLLGSPRGVEDGGVVENNTMFGSPPESDLGLDATMDAAESAQLRALVEGLEAMDAKRSSRNEESLLALVDSESE